MEGSTDHQYDVVAVGAGRRTIGQLAGHEIHLEIEDVLDKKNLLITGLGWYSDFWDLKSIHGMSAHSFSLWSMIFITNST